MHVRNHRSRRRIVRMLAIAALLAVGVARSLHADTVKLRDGTVLTGTVKQVEGGYELTIADGGARRYLKPSEVRTITLTNEPSVPPGVARERLQSLQRSIESEHDVNRIIARYEQFIQMNTDADAVRIAQGELDDYQKKIDAGQTIRFGRDWVTADERDRRLIDAAKSVEAICVAIGAGQLDEATAALRSGLEQQPDNVSLLYLNGVLQLRAGRLAEAKRSFDQVEQQVPNHPPTQLNQAVLAASAKRWPQATQYLDQAISNAPGAPEVLDAITEFVQLIPDNLKRSQSFERLMQRFGPQEMALEQQQAAHGLYRWGSHWVDKATLDKVKAEREAYDKKKADLEAQYKTSTDRVQQLDDRIVSTQQLMRQMESNSATVQPDGRAIRIPLPPAYYDCQQQIVVYQQQRADEVTKQADLHRQADEVKKTEPHPPFTGVLMPIGERGVPVLLPTAKSSDATTAPATESAESTTEPITTTRPATTSSSEVILPANSQAATPPATHP